MIYSLYSVATKKKHLSYPTCLNTNNWDIEFTPKFNTLEIDFFDLWVSQNNSEFVSFRV